MDQEARGERTTRRLLKEAGRSSASFPVGYPVLLRGVVTRLRSSYHVLPRAERLLGLRGKAGSGRIVVLVNGVPGPVPAWECVPLTLWQIKEYAAALALHDALHPKEALP